MKLSRVIQKKKKKKCGETSSSTAPSDTDTAGSSVRDRKIEVVAPRKSGPKRRTYEILCTDLHASESFTSSFTRHVHQGVTIGRRKLLLISIVRS